MARSLPGVGLRVRIRLQLGVGVSTIVTSAAIYGMAAVALLSSSPVAGALIGATFGFVRALSLLPARSGHDRDALLALHGRLGRLDAPVRRLVALLEVLTLIVVVGLVT